ncbi:MAG TPA: zinc ribbon domain-containing protein [Verrucomicrobiae bacterium]|nr:zinc ribbon domain-containing protein [Verrucomicrobiae bacterium]
MPFYDYHCAACGSFALWRGVEARNLPASCPKCQGRGRRVIAAPNLSLMSPRRRQAHVRNEKSRHEPQVSASHRCGSGCGCGSPKTARQKSTRTLDLGKVGRFETSRRPKRPWMLGH